ncbi:MAG: flagellar filament capping protein FliD [Treponema sp.]|jgi:flagellar hook-associated protein 2|nr:flagellar filament capping protein FliD [Treponema sp.]
MAGISIPGISDKYKTQETIESLMKVERIPLTREQSQLEDYKAQRDAWREVNTTLSSLRDATKTLYSFENPFTSKISESTEESAITADANRGADIQSFKIDVIQPATADRFLTNELDKDYIVPSGIYTYKVSDKQLTFNWKGGSISDFSTALNKRGNNILKSMIIGSSAGKKTLLIESLSTGKENKIIFEDQAEVFAKDSGMISPIKQNSISFGKNISELLPVQKIDYSKQERMPELSLSKIKFNNGNTTVSPRGAYQIKIPESVKSNKNMHITFAIQANKVEDITEEINNTALAPDIPNSGFVDFEGIVVTNNSSETLLSIPETPPTPLSEIIDTNIVFAIMKDGTEKQISTNSILNGDKTDIDLSISEYPDISGIAIRNKNTGYSLDVSLYTTFDSSLVAGYIPNNPVSTADDAIIKYEGITITRPTNKIDDVIPEVTLNVHDKTNKTATVSIKTDKESAKDALIQFVGKYNQTIAKINILSQTKSDIIDELDYLSDDEKEKEKAKLGMFQTDFSLTNIKSNMNSIISNGYNFSDSATITMLSQIGIATNASGFSGSYTQSKLRGYLEIDEKKLDSALENNLNDIKSILGYDSDGDLIIDSGIAYKLDKQISAYTQTGGILALKTSTLDSRIKSSETKITKLESQMETKEAELKSAYGQMEGTLNSLESQQNSLSNFSNKQSN